MAHIEKRESGRWRARYRAPDGRERSKTFARKVDAQRFLAAVETDKSRGEWIDPRLGRTRVDDFASRWITAVAPTLKPKTVATYESLLRSRVQPAFGDWPMASIRPSDVQAWVGEMLEEGLSPSRIRQAHVVLSLVLQAAVRDGVIARNVASGVRLPKLARDEAPYFDPATVDRIVAAMPEPYDWLVRILGTLGPRWGEAAALRRSSVTSCAGACGSSSRPRRWGAVWSTGRPRVTPCARCRSRQRSLPSWGRTSPGSPRTRKPSSS
jgi:integrase